MSPIVVPLFGVHLRVIGYVVTDNPTELQLSWLSHMRKVRQSVQHSKRLRHGS